MDLTVVHLTESLGLGGMERVIHSFVRAAPQGKARAICTRAGGATADAMRLEGLRVDILNHGGPGGWDAFLPLYHALRSCKPFLLHTHGAARAVGRWVGRAAGARAVVHHMHGTERYGFLQRLFERLFPPDLYLACSQAVRADFLRQTRANAKGLAVEVLYNPVDCDWYRPDASLRREARKMLNAAETDPIIVTIGRFVQEKGQQYLIQAAPQILSRHPQALMVFIGDGPLRPQIELRASGVARSTRFLGQQTDVRPYLNACDVYVQPSLGREGLGLAVLEAMACGKPAVVSQTQGLEEAVGDCGILVPPGNPKSLAEAVSDLLGDESRIVDLGRQARDRVARRFSADQIQRRLTFLYEQALRRS